REKKRGDIEKADMSKLSDNKHYTDLNEILHKAIQRLPEAQQHVIMLRDYEGYSYDEIGEITGLNPAQVKVYIYRARVALKKYLVKIEYLL
ncbi:MAG: RNA polymerase sigma factor, partial [Flavobacteriales bacterium]|nr:RNA polymerase sigma factor [Flavobacteriales bacterium]